MQMSLAKTKWKQRERERIGSTEWILFCAFGFCVHFHADLLRSLETLKRIPRTCSDFSIHVTQLQQQLVNPLQCRLRFPVAIRQPGDKPKPIPGLDYQACLLSIRNQSMQFVRHSPLTNRFARFHSFARADLHKFPQGARDLCPTLMKLCTSPSSSSCDGSQVDLHNTGWISWRILDAAFCQNYSNIC